jgi:AraC-like DNA-binding protein
MPQQRFLLKSGPMLQVERVIQPFQPTVADGLPAAIYQVPSQRWVLTASAAAEFCVDGEKVLLDGLTALCLPAELSYQLMPLSCRERASVVVSAHAACEHALPPTGAWLLPPRVLWRLQRHWRALALTPAGMDQTPELLHAAVQLATPLSAPWGSLCGQPLSATVRRARRFMVQGFAANPGVVVRSSLGDVADAAACSPSHLSHQFKHQMGISVNRYRQYLRLACGIQRLQDRATRLADLAYELGYCSQSHMGSAFVQALGATPAQVQAALH